MQKDASATSPTAANTPITGTPGTGTRQKTQTLPLGSGFDFYVLSLSWSPSWCLENDPSGRSMQCDPDNNHGFIVHGLWPQNEQGYPEFCRSRRIRPGAGNAGANPVRYHALDGADRP
ncbi:hypothetical protein LP421_11595 [Rhizobium sp. RCAM05350]|nr:hypothetical protein LP421_11595 [Rhizobium sp. RCAM05350]